MFLSQILVLLSTVTFTFAKMKEYTLEKGFVFTFNSDNCKFKIEKYTDCS